MPDENKDQYDPFAEKFWGMILNFIICLCLLLIICVCLFWGSPDIIDASINHLNRGSECQSQRNDC